MAQTVLVTVENIKNPSVKRKMTVASAKLNSRKWRIVEGAPETQAQEVKKKEVVKPVVEVKKAELPIKEVAPEAGDSFNNEFAKIGDDQPSEKESLQKEYEALSGSKPDGRWNEGKLKEKIATLKNAAQ
jgi:hypothetical protein